MAPSAPAIIGVPFPGHRDPGDIRVFMVVERWGITHGVLYLYIAGEPDLDTILKLLPVIQVPLPRSAHLVVIDLGESFTSQDKAKAHALDRKQRGKPCRCQAVWAMKPGARWPEGFEPDPTYPLPNVTILEV
ncbi:hypothetical protein ACQVP2_07515 [Methylobacterium aquaticum]|uniref:hypothetical protein n=1 Tax=Methylobacterium aquaticum TaxID=270351 RepID=UPI003D16ADFC